MKIIGMIGGTDWIITVAYYRIINEEINKRLGGLNAARCILYSVNYAEIDGYFQKNDMLSIYFLLQDAAIKLHQAGADCIVLCANALHIFAEDLQREIRLPIIHIATATANKIKKHGLAKVGLVGTKLTMDQDFYRSKFSEQKIKTFVPEEDERDFIQNIIMNVSTKITIPAESKERFLQIVEQLRKDGAEGIVIGCTEIHFMLDEKDTDLPLFNTLEIHAHAAVDFSLQMD